MNIKVSIASMSSAVLWRTLGGGGVAGMVVRAMAALLVLDVFVSRRGGCCENDVGFVRRAVTRGVMSTGGASEGPVIFVADEEEDVIGREVWWLECECSRQNDS